MALHKQVARSMQEMNDLSTAGKTFCLMSQAPALPTRPRTRASYIILFLSLAQSSLLPTSQLFGFVKGWEQWEGGQCCLFPTLQELCSTLCQPFVLMSEINRQWQEWGTGWRWGLCTSPCQAELQAVALGLHQSIPWQSLLLQDLFCWRREWAGCAFLSSSNLIILK